MMNRPLLHVIFHTFLFFLEGGLLMCGFYWIEVNYHASHDSFVFYWVVGVPFGILIALFLSMMQVYTYLHPEEG